MSTSTIDSEPAAKRIRLSNGHVSAEGFSERRRQLAEELLVLSRTDSALARKLVEEEHADAWYQDDAGWTCLHHAASVCDVELVKFLLQHGAVWNMTDISGLTAGDVAFSMNDDETYDAILQEGIRAEMLKSVMPASLTDTNGEGGKKESADDLDTFLKTKLLFEGRAGEERCVDAEGNGVMMAWEGDLMKKSAQLLCQEKEGLAVLNIGFGLGLIDTALQSYKPRRHLIIEPHPDVLTYMRHKGFLELPGVEVYEGTWQDWMEEVEHGGYEANFDVVYWDTFSETYADLQKFFEVLPILLNGKTARFSFFNGLGATSRLFYDVYTAVAEMHLRQSNLATTWHEVDIPDGGQVDWQGITRRYWNVPSTYRLPVCTLDET